GALVSEALEWRVPHRGRFLERNRLIAALARVTVIIQAPFPSGALSTAAHARELGRKVLVVPGPPWDPRAIGCLRLLRNGASICTCVEDVLSVAAVNGHHATHPSSSDDATHGHTTRCNDTTVRARRGESALEEPGLCPRDKLPKDELRVWKCL